MARNMSREFHIHDEEIVHFLVADNSDGEDNLQLDEEDQQFITQGLEKGSSIIAIESSVGEISLQDPLTSDVSECTLNFNWSENSFVPYEFRHSDYDFGHVNILPDRHDMLSPMDIFMEVTQLDQLVSNIIIKESVRYAQQNRRSFSVSLDEIKAFLGMNFVMSYHDLPTIRSYWSTDEDLGVPFVANVMSRDRFEQIRQNLHFCDNDSYSQRNDRAYKIRPVVHHFNSSFQAAMNNSKRQSIGKRMMKFKGHNTKKQYIKNKPIHCWYKMWCRAESTTGYLFQFDLYTGRNSNLETGLGESVVLNLTEELKGLGCEVYFDNFYNSPALQYKLMMQNIKACGTVRTSRKKLPETLPLDKNMQRGDIYTVSSNGITFTKWMDTKPVHMLTNFISPLLTSIVTRREPETGKKIPVTCPEVVMSYNKYKSGVDLLNQRKACYEVDRKAKIKYYLRLFFDILDIAVNNAYLVYVKLHNAHRVKGPLLSSLEYRQYVARGLINDFTCRQRSRPTLAASEKFPFGNKPGLPDHHIQRMESMKRCVFCAKKRIENRTRNKCPTCNVHLCFTTKRNCFAEYHTNN